MAVPSPIIVTTRHDNSVVIRVVTYYRAIIDVNFIVSGRNYDIHVLTSIVAKLPTVWPVGDMSLIFDHSRRFALAPSWNDNIDKTFPPADILLLNGIRFHQRGDTPPNQHHHQQRPRNIVT